MIIVSLALLFPCPVVQHQGPWDFLGQPARIDKEPVVLIHRVPLTSVELPLRWFSVEQWELDGTPEQPEPGRMLLPARKLADNVLVMAQGAVDALLAGLPPLAAPVATRIPPDPRLVVGWERGSTLVSVQSGSTTVGSPRARERGLVRYPPVGILEEDGRGGLVERRNRELDEPPAWWTCHVYLLARDPGPEWYLEDQDTSQATVGALRVEHDAAGDRGIFRAWEDGRPGPAWLCVGRSQDGQRLWFWFEEGD